MAGGPAQWPSPAGAVKVPAPSFWALIFVGALVVLIGLAHMWVQREQVRLEKDLQKAVMENQRLADVKAKYEASKKKADMYERRVRVIDELKAGAVRTCESAEPCGRHRQQHGRGVA